MRLPRGHQSGGYMDINQLREYKEWIGKTPEEVLTAVRAIPGGWAAVFPGDLPLFAHQVRNVFNVEPLSLIRYPQDHADEFIALIQTRFKDWGFVEKFKAVVGLSGDVYKDQDNRTWYQMSPGGAIYHWGGDPTLAPVDAYRSQYWRGQDGIPIFKLISPDDTGGSLETIIKNEPRRTTIGAVGKSVPVGDQVVEVYRHQGSYNFSETVIAGNNAHERHDVTTHKKWPDYYLNYQNRFSRAGRRFRAHRPDGKLIGYEKGMEPYEFDTRRGYDEPPARPGTKTTNRVPPGGMTATDSFSVQMSPPHFSRNDARSIDLVKNLEYLFRSHTEPKKLLARIEARKANDKAVIDFHNPAILDPHTVRKLLKILRDRPQ